jgi:urea carboxylase
MLYELCLHIPGFLKGDTLTNFLDTKFNYTPCAIDVISPGDYTTVQDFPARETAGHGIPKSGPMDSVSARIANITVGNSPGSETLEMTLSGPELYFTAPAILSVCGAPMSVTIDGQEKPMWSRLVIQAGQKVKIGKITNGGCRAYLAVKGGFPQIPHYLGSKSATPSLGLGGTQGRQLQRGDYLELDEKTYAWAAEVQEFTLPEISIPDYNIAEVYVMNGPHDSDDIMTAKDREMLYSTSWKIGHNSNRTGIRLIGPKPQWGRKDGGEGGSHPSNVFDYCYPSPGGINWGGDSPVVFGMDSPDLGGLICSSTVVSGDLWRLGQVRPGGKVRLRLTTFEHAIELAEKVEDFVERVQKLVGGISQEAPVLELELPQGGASAILKKVDGNGEQRPKVVYRQVSL